MEKNNRLQDELFGDDSHILSGINFEKYDAIKVSVRPAGAGPPPCETGMNLPPRILENIALAKYNKPTPVQKHTIPIISSGYDCIGHGQTGSGKTAAFLIPTLTLFMKHNIQPTRGLTPTALILAPTRELASQIYDEARRFCYKTPYKPALIYGGMPKNTQYRSMMLGCDILVATPGRLKDFMNSGLSLKNIKILILDEADRMLDMGFIVDIRAIVDNSDMPRNRQTLMFSATIPREIRSLAEDYLKDKFLFVRVGRVGAAGENIIQKVVEVQQGHKMDRLVDILMTHVPQGRTLIFVDTKKMADTIDHFLHSEVKLPCTSIHGDRSQAEREDALKGFRSGVTPILVATDVASRGLDIKDIVHVINYDCPKDIDSYVHRIGRTARAGNVGFATTFYNRSCSNIAGELARILKNAGAEVPKFLHGHYSNRAYESDEDEE